MMRALAVFLITSALSAHQPPSSTWIVFVDDLHLDFRNTGGLRELIKAVASDVIQANDAYAVRSSGPSQLSMEWTSDRMVLQSQAKKVTGNGLKPSDIIVSSPEARFEVAYRADIALGLAAELVSAAAARGGPVGLIYISNGYDIDSDAFRERLRGLAQTARVANVRIFTIDPRVLRGAITGDPAVTPDRWDAHVATTQNSLRLLAEETGGIALLDSQETTLALERIAAARD